MMQHIRVYKLRVDVTVKIPARYGDSITVKTFHKGELFIVAPDEEISYGYIKFVPKDGQSRELGWLWIDTDKIDDLFKEVAK